MMMIDKTTIQRAVRDQFNLPDDVGSGHIKMKRWVLKPRRILTEMIETYRFTRGLSYVGDRDNDDTFLPDLVYAGIAHRLLECQFELDKTESKVGEYSMKLDKFQYQDYEAVRTEKGWMRQEFLANSVYTALLYSYPDFKIGEVYKAEILFYPELLIQPNTEYHNLHDQLVVIAEHNLVTEPWILCETQTGERRYIRKNFLIANRIIS
jgi:hypothetical protein